MSEMFEDRNMLFITFYHLRYQHYIVGYLRNREVSKWRDNFIIQTQLLWFRDYFSCFPGFKDSVQPKLNKSSKKKKEKKAVLTFGPTEGSSPAILLNMFLGEKKSPSGSWVVNDSIELEYLKRF